MAYMDYMDTDICCLKKAFKLNHSLTHLLQHISQHMLFEACRAHWDCAHIALLVVNHGISNTIMLKIP